METFPPLSKTPIAGKLYIAVAYFVLLPFTFFLMGGFNGFATGVVAMAFSFQFWTYTTHAGIKKYFEENHPQSTIEETQE